MARIVVVGAGLGGSLVAMLLARRRHHVDVFERFADARSDHGSRRPALSLTLCERGLRALDRVGLREAVLALAVPARGRRIHAPDGSSTYQPYGNRGEAIYSISRAALNQCLVEFAQRESGVRFHFEQRCAQVDVARTRARFEGVRTGTSTELSADVIIGADGAYSTVRSHLQKTELFNYSQQYWRFGGYKSFWVPPAERAGAALPGEALHIWPQGARMMMGFPNRDGSGMLSLLLPFKGEDSLESLTTASDVSRFFSTYFPAALGMVPDLPAKFLASSANALLTIRCDPWSDGNGVLLIGDAAHALLPSYGQGANAAFEDCAVLDDCVQLHGADWRAILQDFEHRRKPDLNVMADLCADHFVELSELVADPAFLKRREVERRLEELYPELYRPLYSMVSFSCMPYADAFELEKRQRATVDRILALPGVEARLDSAEVRDLLRANTTAATPDVGREAVDDSGSGRIFDLAMGFWGAKALLSAVELGVFAELGRGPRTGAELSVLLGLHERGARDYLDALTALGLLVRSGEVYANARDVAKFLDPQRDTYIGGAFELANSRLYPVWGKLTEALRSGLPQNEAKAETDYYANLVQDPERLHRFLRAMTGLSRLAARVIAQRFDWQRYSSFVDLGGAQGALAVEIASEHSHLTGVNLDLPPIRSSFEAYAKSRGLQDRLRFHSADFFVDPLPRTDVVVMGHVLHNWDLEQKQLLIRRAYQALKPGGALIVHEALIDDDRRTNGFGLLMSLNMLLVTPGGFVFSGADCELWMRAAGFDRIRVEHLHGPDWMVVGSKPNDT